MSRLALDRIEEILDAGRGVRVLVVGDLMVDRYLSGSVDRVSPEAPVPVVRVREERIAVGGAANVCANVAALGASCGAVGCAGRDGAADQLRSALSELGVDDSGIVCTDERPTTVKTRVLARHQQVVRFDREVETEVSAGLAESLAAAVVGSARGADVLVIEDYDKGVLVPRVIGAATEVGRARGLTTVVDPKRRNFFSYAGATVFKPNARELADALGEHLRPDDPGWMEETRRRLQCDNLLLTLGEGGMALQTGAGTAMRIPGVGRDVYDVSGAGDTVTAVLAVALGAGATPVEAALLSNHAAALEVAKVGAATVSPEELLDHFATLKEP